MPQDILSPLWLTLKVSFIATCFALVLGSLAAMAVMRLRWRFKDVLDAVLTLPMVLPPTVLGYYLLVVFGRNGALGGMLEEYLGVRLIFTWQGAVLASLVVAFPLVYRTARAALEGVPASCEQAARTLGAGEWEVFLFVSLPLAWRGILAGSMLALARAMGEFGATLMIAGNLPGRTQTLSLAVYSAVQAGDDARANLLVCIVSVVCIVLLVATSRLLKPRY
ncbi:molybdate ABC transporter permease subunit [Megalodesulfovibrio gigas]|uniref:Molybdenum transport system permease n=1 Tax=Megalodesulfovibrio gigas (strain ATCC 19364 / DSM 1382 / NCIMB 9332 / VKM B-1759) TaxID=1121448 RepID=T2GF41_MEGG1|nr:molybdate ABC transporter permease subunit [Megalodesulfovibrio gigas]AGW14908.1 putative molybdate ABC transporter, inner membrane subunit [Megalodesulfovibrio gigas DSM 1382 = ATCC 19364]